MKLRMAEEKTDFMHKAVKVKYSGSVSLCGNNSAWIEGYGPTKGRLVKVYGGAKRTFKDSKVTCEDCKKMMKEGKQVPDAPKYASAMAEIFELEKKIASKKYQVLSPDGFRIDFSKSTYPSLKSAKDAFKKWKKQFEDQGYYSSASHGRIDLYDLEDYCQFNQQGDPNWKQYT